MAAIYTKEKLKNNIFVPESVESELKSNIERQLQKCGIFYRVFSRRKSASSLEHKFATGKYGGEDNKMIQDLVGLRVNLYFQDDIEICKELFEDIYEIVEGEDHRKWSESDHSNKNFEATKINGVFKLPDYLVDKISKETWDMSIDKTFEIQIKTVFFEGWHEVEHDFRYKIDSKDESDPSNIWNQYATFSRQFNSVVATLELCDKSIVSLFDNFAYELYRNQQWEMMIRMHFRIRISGQHLYPGIAEILAKEDERGTMLGKKLLRAKRSRLIHILNTFHRDIPISVNMIIALLNESVLDNNEEIRAIMKAHSVYKDGVLIVEKTYERRDLLPLENHNVFKTKVLVTGTKESKLDRQAVYSKLADYLYHWTKDKFRYVFRDLTEERSQFKGVTSGYQISFVLNDELCELEMYTSHLAYDIGGRTWVTVASLYPDEASEGIWLEVENVMTDQMQISMMERVSRFTYPKFFKDIYTDEEIKLVDVVAFGENPFGVRRDNDIETLTNMINSDKLYAPVVILASENSQEKTEKGFDILDESWLGNSWLNGLHNQVKFYAHVYRCDVNKMPEILKNVNGLTVNDGNVIAGNHKVSLEEPTKGVYVFWPVEKLDELFYEKGYPRFDFFSEARINNCTYSRYKGEGAGIREDKVKDGPNAFMFLLVDKIKEYVIR